MLLPRKRARGTSARCENPKDNSRIRELVVVVIVVRLTLFFLFFDPLPLPPKRQILEILLERKDLSESQSASTMAALLEGAHPAQIAAFLVLLRAKGETGEEVAGLAAVGA